MFRRYESKWSRFAQHDPYDGSYNLSDPQSLNRYAYVQNDPVNFTDPSGLLPNDQCPLDGSPCNIYSGYSPIERELRAWLRYANNRNRMPYVPGTGEPRGGRGGGHEGTPQDTTPRQEINDCIKFSFMVQDIADRANSRNAFLDGLASTFTAANNSSISEMRRTANMALPAGRPTFGAGGFKEQFRDPSNQVRHFVGGFIAGARVGWFPARTFMNNREEPNTNGENSADIALNGVSTVMGASTIGNTIGSIRNNIGDAIRRSICQ
jgi:hypothetical protein